MPIPARSPKRPTGYFINSTKASKCLFLLGRLKDQQAILQNFVKANKCQFLLGQLKDQQAKSIKIIKVTCRNDPRAKP